MIVEIPFGYELDYVPARGRSRRRVLVRDTMPVVFEATVEAACPVALVLHEGRAGRAGAPPEPVSYRSWKGRLVLPFPPAPALVGSSEDGPFPRLPRDGMVAAADVIPRQVFASGEAGRVLEADEDALLIPGPTP